MEDHLRNRDRLAKEWQALCAYQAEPNACSIAQSEANLKKNRHPDFVPCEHPVPTQGRGAGQALPPVGSCSGMQGAGLPRWGGWARVLLMAVLLNWLQMTMHGSS